MLQQTTSKGPAVVAIQPQDAPAMKPTRDYTKLLIPLSVVAAVCVLVGVSSQRWDRWMAGADTQKTDNAYIRAELSRLSARVSGNVSAINVGDFDHVKAGDVLVEIDPADYLAKQAQAKAAVDAAIGQLTNLENQKTLQKAAIRQAEAQSAVAKANADLAKTEADRQVALADKGVGTQQKNEQAQAAVQSTAATALAAEASVASARAQFEYIDGQADQFSANVEAARAALKTADLLVSYTKITAPFDGVVSERQVHVGDYVTVGTNSISIVPLPAVYMIANFKETQLSRMKEGQVATVTVDALPGETFKGHISRLSPASGSQFALLPADNATGNFTKVVQRVPVRIDFEASPSLEHLRSGMSAEVTTSVVSEGR